MLRLPRRVFGVFAQFPDRLSFSLLTYADVFVAERSRTGTDADFNVFDVDHLGGGSRLRPRRSRGCGIACRRARSGGHRGGGAMDQEKSARLRTERKTLRVNVYIKLYG